MREKLATAVFIATLLAVPAAFADSSPDSASPPQPGDPRPASSDDGGHQVIFLQDGRTIRADKTERIGDQIRIETPTGRIDLPSSEVLSIHRMDSPSGSPSGPPPAEVYRGLTQQLTDQVRGQIQKQSRPSQVR